MIIVLDSSAAVEIILKRKKAEQFRAIINTAEKVITSDLYRIEIVNVLWKYVKAGFLEKDTANKLLVLAENLIDEFINISENNLESLNESIRVNELPRKQASGYLRCIGNYCTGEGSYPFVFYPSCLISNLLRGKPRGMNPIAIQSFIV